MFKRSHKGSVWLPGRLFIGLMAALGPASIALAGSFAVNPVRVTLSGSKTIAALTVRNSGTDPTVVQLDLMSWSQHDGANVLVPTEDLLATPPVFTLQPGATQIIRVGLRRAVDATHEMTYRMILREVLPERSGEQGLRVALQVSLPIFVPPPGRTLPKLEWKLVRTGGDGLRLTATNQGNSHIQIANFRIMMPDGKSSIANKESAEYLLPGTTLSWNLHTSANLAAGAPLRVQALTDVGELRANLILESDGALVAGH